MLGLEFTHASDHSLIPAATACFSLTRTASKINQVPWFMHCIICPAKYQSLDWLSIRAELLIKNAAFVVPCTAFDLQVIIKIMKLILSVHVHTHIYIYTYILSLYSFLIERIHSQTKNSFPSFSTTHLHCFTTSLGLVIVVYTVKALNQLF